MILEQVLRAKNATLKIFQKNQKKVLTKVLSCVIIVKSRVSDGIGH